MYYNRRKILQKNKSENTNDMQCWLREMSGFAFVSIKQQEDKKHFSEIQYVIEIEGNNFKRQVWTNCLTSYQSPIIVECDWRRKIVMCISGGYRYYCVLKDSLCILEVFLIFRSLHILWICWLIVQMSRITDSVWCVKVKEKHKLLRKSRFPLQPRDNKMWYRYITTI